LNRLSKYFSNEEIVNHLKKDYFEKISLLTEEEEINFDENINNNLAIQLQNCNFSWNDSVNNLSDLDLKSKSLFNL
jgi:hypothetical protein